MEGSNGYRSAAEPGARRRRLAGYLKAANEQIRQSYQQYSQGGRDGSEDDTMPGSFPDAAIVRSGDEEMLLFPSYAKRHRARQMRRHEIPGASDDLREGKGSGDAQYWKEQWEKYEDQDSIVDVDVRGWIYSPHKGQMTRKNRLLVGIARRLSGIPAPSSSRGSSPQSSHRARLEARADRREEELVEKEAESIRRKGQGEAEIAGRGGYSEIPSRVTDRTSIYSSPDNSRSPSPAPHNGHAGLMSRPASDGSLRAESYDSAMNSGHQKRAAWNQPSDMTAAELAVANSHLMVRLKPFLNNPLNGTPLTVFFYNEETSRSRTVMTNEAGHFQLRAALDFVPTHARVLASDKLSATEEVRIIESNGVSMISDIDDTIKHSAISSGAKEIFRNTFIRNLDDLIIDGVKEWYTTMADMNVNLHYVSNAPWQLFPVLVNFFAEAGLPRGSFHLKQYTGMLQGIFEPVAERKKGTLEKIMSDFPERRFILVGDSGEADLELYTDIMLANPGRILGVFIRDVTSTKPQGFFDSAARSRPSRSPLRGRRKDTGSLSPRTRAVTPEEKTPNLPPRPTRFSSSLATNSTPDNPTMCNLIDLDDPLPDTPEDFGRPKTITRTSTARSLPPSRPSKPPSLRSKTHTPEQASNHVPASPLTRRSAPPLPPKPRKYSSSTENPNLPSEPSPLSQIQTSSPPGSRATSQERQSYRAAVKNKVASAYNALPSWSGATVPTLTPATPPSSNSYQEPSKSNIQRQPPPIPPRRNVSSYPASVAQAATNRLSGSWSPYSTASSTTSRPNNQSKTSSYPNDSSSEDMASGYRDPMLGLSKKEEMWLRRWQQAKECFEDRGVVLRSWRVGSDVALDCVRIVEEAMREDQSERGRMGRGKESGRRERKEGGAGLRGGN